MQIVKDETKNKLTTGFSDLRNDVLKYIDSLALDIQEKELVIENLREEVSSLKSELKQSEGKYLAVSGELDQTRNQFVKVMDVIENMKSTILNITIPNDAAVKSDYDEEITDWDGPSIKDIFLIIKHSLISNYFEIADRALLILCDSYIREDKVPEAEWLEIYNLLDGFIDRQTETGQNLTEGIVYLIKTAAEMKCTKLLEHMVIDKGEAIENMILSQSLAGKAVEQVFALLNTYYVNSFDINTQRLLSKILDSSSFVENNVIDNKHCMELLFVSMCCGMDDAAIEKEYIQGNLNDDIPEIKCYNLYYDVINNTIPFKEGIRKIEKLKYEMKVINPGLKEKVLEYITESLNKNHDEDEINENVKNITISNFNEKVKRKEKSLFIYPKDGSGSNKGVMAISFIKKGKKECPVCETMLKLQNAELAFYAGKGKIAGYMECELLYCDKCDGFFADQLMMDEIIPEIRPHKIRLAQSQTTAENGNQENIAY